MAERLEPRYSNRGDLMGERLLITSPERSFGFPKHDLVVVRRFGAWWSGFCLYGWASIAAVVWFSEKIGAELL